MILKTYFYDSCEMVDDSQESLNTEKKNYGIIIWFSGSYFVQTPTFDVELFGFF